MYLLHFPVPEKTDYSAVAVASFVSILSIIKIIKGGSIGQPNPIEVDQEAFWSRITSSFRLQTNFKTSTK